MSERPSPKRRVLVIDDEESIRYALSRGLGRAGYDVVSAETGHQGVEALAGGRFDAVLTDLRLPDLSGLDIVAVLTETAPDVPVVVMTGYASLDSAREAMKRGARDYVQKPFSVDAIATLLDRVMSASGDADEERRLRARVERSFAPAGYAKADEAIEALKPAPSAAAPAAKPGEPPPLEEARREFEVRYVEDLLARTGGNVAAAARLAGISRPNFHKKLRTLGVDPAPFKRAARRGRNA